MAAPGPCCRGGEEEQVPFLRTGLAQVQGRLGEPAWSQTPQTGTAHGEPIPKPCAGTASAELSHQLHGGEEKHYVRGV